MKEMQEMRAMLDKLNIGPVTPSIASSPSNSAVSYYIPAACQLYWMFHFVGQIEPARPSLGKLPAPSNGCHNGTTTRAVPRLASNGMSPSELQYSPSESSSSSFSVEEQSATPQSSPQLAPNLVAVSYPSFAPIPFQWRPEAIAATPNGLVALKEVITK